MMARTRGILKTTKVRITGFPERPRCTSGQCIAPICASRKQQHYSGNRHNSAYFHYRLFPSVMRFYRHYSGQPTHRGTRYSGKYQAKDKGIPTIGDTRNHLHHCCYCRSRPSPSTGRAKKHPTYRAFGLWWIRWQSQPTNRVQSNRCSHHRYHRRCHFHHHRNCRPKEKKKKKNEPNNRALCSVEATSSSG